MVERIEAGCQKISDNWYKHSQAAYYKAESFYDDKPLDELLEIAKRASYSYVASLYDLGPKLDLDYAAEGNGRLFWFYKTMHERREAKLKKQTLDSKDISDSHFDLVLTQTYLVWRFLESYYLIRNLPSSTDELETTTKTLKSILACTHNVLIEYQSELTHEFTKVQDELLDLSRGRIRLINHDKDFDMEIPYFRNQKRIRK